MKVQSKHPVKIGVILHNGEEIPLYDCRDAVCGPWPENPFFADERVTDHMNLDGWNVYSPLTVTSSRQYRFDETEAVRYISALFADRLNDDQRDSAVYGYIANYGYGINCTR